MDDRWFGLGDHGRYLATTSTKELEMKTQSVLLTTLVCIAIAGVTLTTIGCSDSTTAATNGADSNAEHAEHGHHDGDGDQGTHNDEGGHHDGDNDSAEHGHKDGGGHDRDGEGHHGKDGDGHDRDEHK